MCAPGAGGIVEIVRTLPLVEARAPAGTAAISAAGGFLCKNEKCCILERSL
jgi:hypothetical protein